MDVIGIIVATVVSTALGMWWYGPGFGKLWTQLAGISKKQRADARKMAPKAMLAGIISTLVMAYVMDLFIIMAGAGTAAAGTLIGLLAWLGFIATTSFGRVIWEGGSVRLYYLNSAYNLLSLALMGAILAVL
ncbi:hypothetical protein AUJ68_07030 [Candidatus Woesearchaeota archaeon CG1_02_57_44]|nr:MAG: hypothetical protein AUJ68_07030 [Candidatus Woesearchaeota archaeon CG1_02_57_44]PIN69868.1 MAG: hypothetical protein COV94_02405 [Candidatus Woesearchaeota archaeon CG11_big_fil_rev_8_21_14_0_20_57_5]